MKDKTFGIIGGTGKHGFGIAKKLVRAGFNVSIGSRNQEKGEKKAEELKQLSADISGVGQISGGDNTFAAKAEVIILSIPFKGSEELLNPLSSFFENKILVDVMVNLKFDLLEKGESTYAYLASKYDKSDIVSCLKTVATSLLNSGEEINQTDFVVAKNDEAASIGVTISQLMGLQPIAIRDPIHAVTVENLVSLAIHINKTYKGSHAGFLVTNVKN